MADYIVKILSDAKCINDIVAEANNISWTHSNNILGVSEDLLNHKEGITDVLLNSLELPSKAKKVVIENISNSVEIIDDDNIERTRYTNLQVAEYYYNIYFIILKITKTTQNSFNSLFAPYPNVRCINTSLLDTSDVTKYNYMFYNCSSLKEITLGNINSLQLINVFGGCRNLETLVIGDFSSCDEKQFTQTYHGTSSMFSKCSNLKNIIINGQSCKANWSLSDSPLLTNTSIINILTSLYDYRNDIEYSSLHNEEMYGIAEGDDQYNPEYCEDGCGWKKTFTRRTISLHANVLNIINTTDDDDIAMLYFDAICKGWIIN